MRKKIAIVTGEPNSINTEIIGKTWKKLKILERRNLFLIGNLNLIKYQLKKNNIKIPLKEINNISKINSSKFMCIYNIPIKAKNINKINNNENRKYIFKSLTTAHYFAKKKIILSFINCSINKEKLFKSKSIGITEYLAKLNNVRNREVMMIYNDNLAVVPITTHIKIKDVSKKLSTKLIIKKIKTINLFYKKNFKKKPKIGLMGLNPHNFENRNNSEEKKIIIPAVKILRKQKYKVIGPLSADTIFINRKKFNLDVIVGMYHDQVLTPFKTIYGFNAVNVTLGLSYLRVSPDHGTGEDIKDLGTANPESLIKCVKFLNKINND